MISSVVPGRIDASRRSVAALFVVNAMVFASVVTRFAEVKQEFGLGELSFGVMVACGPVGSVLGSVVAGRLVAGVGAVRVAAFSSVILGVLLTLVGIAGSAPVLGAILFAVGVADATADVANNTHGLEIERRLGRSIINGLHGAWSAGAIAGGLLGLAALQLQVPREAHFLLLGLAIVAVSLVSLPRLPLPPSAPGPEVQAPHARRSVSCLLLVACALAVVGAFLEDLGSTWGGIYLREENAAPLADTGFAFVAMMGAVTIGRFVSDRLVDRIGASATAQIGSALSLAGLLLVVVAPVAWVTIIGFGLLGLGIAPLIPLAMGAADRAPGLAVGTGVAVAATVMRLGFLASPLLVGAVAEASGLRTALAICLLVPVSGIVLAQRLRSAAP